MKPHVCLLGPATAVHTQRWAASLAARGCRVSILSPEAGGHSGSAFVETVPVFRFATATSEMSPSKRMLTLLRGWGRVPAIIAMLKPNIVHVHSLPTPSAIPWLLRVKRLVVSAWGSDVVQRDSRKSRMYPYLLAHAASITATSHYLARVVATYLRRPRNVHVVPFGVDLDLFTPPACTPKTATIGSLRHLETVYGLDVLIKALPELLCVDSELQLLIGGEGTQRHALEALVHQLGVERHVALHGRVPHAKAASFLQSLTLFAVPSRAESFGVAALEAQACGLPVVASNVGGLPEVVRDGETGILVPPEDPHALASALAGLLSDPHKAMTMGKAARQWVESTYRWEDNVAQMLRIYDEVLCAVS